MWSPSAWSPPRTASRCPTRRPTTWSTRSAPGTMLDGLDEAVIGLSAGESATLHLDAGRRSAEGRGGRHRGHGHQGAGAGAARGRRRVRPAGLGVRHHRRAARRHRRAADPRWPGSSRPARPATPCWRPCWTSSTSSAGQPAGVSEMRPAGADHRPARPGRPDARRVPGESEDEETRPRRSSGPRSRQRADAGHQGPDGAWTRWPRSAAIERRPERPHPAHPAQGAGGRRASAAGRRPPARSTRTTSTSTCSRSGAARPWP